MRTVATQAAHVDTAHQSQGHDMSGVHVSVPPPMRVEISENASDAGSEQTESIRSSDQNVAEIYAKVIGASLAESNRQLIENLCASRKSSSSRLQTKDITLCLHQPGDGPHMCGLNQLPSNHPNTKAVTDLDALSKFTGMNIIATVLNEVFDFCIARMINHQSLLSLIQGLQMFSEGMKERVGSWVKELEINQFISLEDNEDQAQSLATTRMLVFAIRKLCLEFYVTSKESAIDIINRMNAASYSSVGFSATRQ